MLADNHFHPWSGTRNCNFFVSLSTIEINGKGDPFFAFECQVLSGLPFDNS